MLGGFVELLIYMYADCVGSHSFILVVSYQSSEGGRHLVFKHETRDPDFKQGGLGGGYCTPSREERRREWGD